MAKPVFTGIIEHTGTLSAAGPAGSGYRLTVATDLEQIVEGESVAVNGACLTVAKVLPDGFTADVSAETARATTLGRLTVGARVNLERALRLSDRLGGHLVSGHVDGVARVDKTQQQGTALKVTLTAPSHTLPYVAPKGSVALDGVSLTVNGVAGPRFDVMLIPYTAEHTTLQGVCAGRELNIEADLLARYVAHYLASKGRDAQSTIGPGQGSDSDRTLWDKLKRANIV
jgi:riboflavin synthase